MYTTVSWRFKKFISLFSLLTFVLVGSGFMPTTVQVAEANDSVPDSPDIVDESQMCEEDGGTIKLLAEGGSYWTVTDSEDNVVYGPEQAGTSDEPNNQDGLLLEGLADGDYEVTVTKPKDSDNTSEPTEFTVDCVEEEPVDINPIFECWEPDPQNDGKYIAHFGWENKSGEEQEVPFGEHNQVTPEGYETYFPTMFDLPTDGPRDGRTPFYPDTAIQITDWDGSSIVWNLTDQGTETASLDGPRCPEIGPDPDDQHQFSPKVYKFVSEELECSGPSCKDNDDAEDNLSGWEFNLYRENPSTGAWEFIASATTPDDDEPKLASFPQQQEAGVYHVCEVSQEGYTQTYQDWSGTPYHVITDNQSPNKEVEGPYCASTNYTDESDRSWKKYFGNYPDDEDRVFSCEDGIFHLDTEESDLYTVTPGGVATFLQDYEDDFYAGLAANADARLYSITSNDKQLVELLPDGTTVDVGSPSGISGNVIAMNFAPDGTLYAMTQNDILYEVNTSTGMATQLRIFKDLDVRGGDLVVPTDDQIVYTREDGEVYVINLGSFSVSNPGSIGDTNHITSTAYDGTTHYAMDRNDDFYSFTLNPFSSSQMSDGTGPFAYGDGSSCPVEEEPEETTLVAYKVMCEAEEYLPNWGEGGPNITASTAQTWVDESDGKCQLVPDWQFEFGGSGDPGDSLVGPAGGDWQIFGPTDGSGMTSVDISDYVGDDRLWVREVLQEGFVDFSHEETPDNSDDYSAQFYCHTDVLNNDNWDFISNVEVGETYYCAGFNAPIEDVPVCDPEVNLLANPSFEEPEVETAQGWNIFESGNAELAWLVNWVSPDGDAPDNGWAELHRGVNGWTSSHGDQHTELDSDYEGPGGSNNESASVTMYQEVSTIPGETYTLNYDFSPRPNTGASENVLEVLIDGVQVDTQSQAGGSGVAWNTYSYSFTADSATTKIGFRDGGISNSRGTLLDNTDLRCDDRDDDPQDPPVDLPDLSEVEITCEDGQGKAHFTAQDGTIWTLRNLDTELNVFGPDGGTYDVDIGGRDGLLFGYSQAEVDDLQADNGNTGSSEPGLEDGEYEVIANHDGEIESKTFNISCDDNGGGDDDGINQGTITDPETDGDVEQSPVTLGATYSSNDGSEDPVQWAVRADTCDPDTEATVAGNVDGLNTPYSWDYVGGSATFSSSVGLSPGDYCFVFNPNEDDGNDVRETREFVVEQLVQISTNNENDSTPPQRRQPSPFSGPGGQTAGAFDELPEPDVLGATDIEGCDDFLTSFLHIDKINNNPVDIIKLKLFLNLTQGEDLDISSNDFTPELEAAVERFQVGEADEVLRPWYETGLLPTPTTPTGYVYVTTRDRINEMMCGSLGDIRDELLELIPDRDINNDIVGD